MSKQLLTTAAEQNNCSVLNTQPFWLINDEKESLIKTAFSHKSYDFAEKLIDLVDTGEPLYESSFTIHHLISFDNIAMYEKFSQILPDDIETILDETDYAKSFFCLLRSSLNLAQYFVASCNEQTQAHYVFGVMTNTELARYKINRSDEVSKAPMRNNLDYAIKYNNRNLAVAIINILKGMSNKDHTHYYWINKAKKHFNV